jgi:hypothetical protein
MSEPSSTAPSSSETRPTRMVVAAFAQHEDAARAVPRLRDLEIPETAIRMIEGAAPDAAGSRDGILPSHLGLPEADHEVFAEALLRGCTLVVVQDLTAEQTPPALAVLDDASAIDMEGREAAWRQEGWSGRAGSGTLPSGIRGTTRDMAFTNPRDDTDNYEGPSQRAHTPDADDNLQARDMRLARDTSAGRGGARSYSTALSANDTQSTRRP